MKTSLLALLLLSTASAQLTSGEPCGEEEAARAESQGTGGTGTGPPAGGEGPPEGGEGPPAGGEGPPSQRRML